MSTDAKHRANARYDKANMRRVTVSFSPKDHDLHDWLAARAEERGVSVPALVRALLREAKEDGAPGA